MDLETFLQEKGYIIGTIGAKYYSMLLEEVICALGEKIPKETIKEQIIPNAEDFYYRFHTISKKKYINEITLFCNTKIVDGNKMIITESVEDSLLRLGKKYIKENQEENVKTYQKCKKK